MRILSAILIGLVLCISTTNVAASSGKVVTEGGLPLNIRSSPNTQAGIMGTLPAGSSIDLQCHLDSQVITGVKGTTAVWYKLKRGGYVSAAFISGGSAPRCSIASPFTARANVRSGLPLNVRSGPNTGSGIVGSIPVNAEFKVDCQANGEKVSGDSGTTSVWYHVPSKGGYVSGAFVNNGGKSAPACRNIPTPSGRDCSAGLKNPRTCAQAVAWAEAHLTNHYNAEYAGMCDHVVGLAYGRQYSGFNSALIHWQTTPAQFKHYDRNPPPGALVFFGQPPFGHATISTGGGNIISTDIPVPGALGRTTIDFIDRVHRNPYLGWTNPYFHNA